MAAILAVAASLCGCSTALETTLVSPGAPVAGPPPAAVGIPASSPAPGLAAAPAALPAGAQAYGPAVVQPDGYPVANRPGPPLSSLKSPEEQAEIERRLRASAAAANAAASGARPPAIDGQLQALGRTHAIDAVKAIEADAGAASDAATAAGGAMPCLRGQPGCAATQ